MKNLYVDYRLESDIDEAKPVANAVGMIIVGVTMVITGLTVLDRQLKESAYY